MKRYRHRIHVFASRAHKWLALFIGAQLLIWFACGALMSFLPIDEVRLFDARTGMPRSPIDAALATRIASKAWKADSKPASKTIRVTAESPEYRGSLPAWRVAFADPDATSVFVAADTGRITAVRTGTWRLHDFFCSLHIMDWKNHENFNTPWLLGFAIGGLLFGLAGTVLLFMRWPFRRRRSAR